MKQQDSLEVYEVLKYLALQLVEAIDEGDNERIQMARANYDNTRAMYDAEQAELQAWITSRSTERQSGLVK